MKRFVAILILLTTCFCLFACTDDADEPPASNASGGTELSESEIEAIVVDKLFSTISKECGSRVDAGSCRYSINKTEKKGGDIYVYGKVWLYNKYGELVTLYSDGSGPYSPTFTIKMSSSGYAYTCDLE